MINKAVMLEGMVMNDVPWNLRIAIDAQNNKNEIDAMINASDEIAVDEHA